MKFSFCWKEILALGAVVSSIILVVKIDAESAEKVSIKVVDACKEYAVAVKGD